MKNSPDCSLSSPPPHFLLKQVPEMWDRRCLCGADGGSRLPHERFGICCYPTFWLSKRALRWAWWIRGASQRGVAPHWGACGGDRVWAAQERGGQGTWPARPGLVCRQGYRSWQKRRMWSFLVSEGNSEPEFIWEVFNVTRFLLTRRWGMKMRWGGRLCQAALSSARQQLWLTDWVGEAVSLTRRGNPATVTVHSPLDVSSLPWSISWALTSA